MFRAVPRRLLVPTALGFRRVRARPTAFGLAAAGIGLVACALAIVSAASLVVQDRAVARSIAHLPPAERTVEVTWVGVPTTPAETKTALDRTVRAAVSRLGLSPPVDVMLYRETRLGKTLVRLGAVDGLGRAVELGGGRAPRTCLPGRCEVLAIETRSPQPAPGLTISGRGSLRPGPVAAFFSPALPGGRLRLAENVETASRLPVLSFSQRTYGWLLPLRPGDVRSWKVDDFQRRLVRARTTLEARSSAFDLTGPTTELAAAAAKSRIAGRRLLLVGGEAAVLFLAFVLLAASRLREEARNASRRLEWFGAARWQVRVSALVEAALVVVPATLIGWLVGTAGAFALADTTDTPAGAVVSRASASPTAAAFLLGIAGAGIVVFYLGARAPSIPVGARSLTVADVAAVGAVAAVLVAFSTGAADARALATSGGTGVVLLILPGLIALAAAVVLSRLFLPGLRLVERVAPHRALRLRLALLSLARAPGIATVSAVFVALSVGLGVFAVAYRSTLIRNEADTAAFEAPLDYVVRSHGEPLAYQPPIDAVPVLRRSGEAPSLEHRAVTLLGLPPSALPRLHWRDDFSQTSRRDLAARIGGPPVAMRGIAIPPDATELELPVLIRGDPIHLSMNIRTPTGSFLVVDLGEPATGRPTVARAHLPAAARGGLVVGMPVEFTTAGSFTAEHRATSTAPPIDVFRIGVLRLGIPRTRGPHGARALEVDYRNWVASQSGPSAGGSRHELRVHYFLTQQQVYRLRPRQPTDEAAIPVLASASLASAVGANGVLPLFVGTSSVNVRIVATAQRFPSLSGDFVVGDRSRLETALDTSVPGSAVDDEAWVAGGPGLTARLASAPVPVSVVSRRSLEHELRADPLARGSLLVFAAAAAVALALSLLGLVLSVAVDLRDEDGGLVDLETQGLGPSGLRDHLRLRMLAVLAAGLVGGLAIGAVLALVVLRAVAVSANSTEPVPPLVLEPGWGVLLLALAAFVALAVLAVLLQTRAAFREPAAVRAQEGT